MKQTLLFEQEMEKVSKGWLWSLTIPMEPVSLQSHVKVKPKGKYSTKFKKEYQKQICDYLDIWKPSQPFDFPLRVSWTFVFRRPKYLLKKSPESYLLMAKKPDYDDVVKYIQDCFGTGVLFGISKEKQFVGSGVWTDDNLIVDSRIRQFYAKGEDKGKIIIKVKKAKGIWINK